MPPFTYLMQLEQYAYWCANAKARWHFLLPTRPRNKGASSSGGRALPAMRAYHDNRVMGEPLVHLVNKPEADESADRTEDY